MGKCNLAYDMLWAVEVIEEMEVRWLKAGKVFIYQEVLALAWRLANSRESMSFPCRFVLMHKTGNWQLKLQCYDRVK